MNKLKNKVKNQKKVFINRKERKKKIKEGIVKEEKQKTG